MRSALSRLLVVAGLALAAPAGAATTHCAAIEHGGYRATAIEEQGMGCVNAHGMIRHVIDHGTSGLHHFECARTHGGVANWSCSAVIKGEKIGVQFVLRPYRRPVTS